MPNVRPQARQVLKACEAEAPVAELLAVATDAVAAITDEFFNSGYKSATDHAEGARIAEQCDKSSATIRGMARRLPEADLVAQSEHAPVQDVGSIVAKQPEGMRGVLRGLSNPERMTRNAVYNDIREHFNQKTTVPAQLAEESRVDIFEFSSAAQFQHSMELMKDDLPNRLHLEADDFHAPLGKGEVRRLLRLNRPV